MFRQRRADPFGQQLSEGDPAIGHNDDELFAAPASELIEGPHATARHQTKVAQDLVADGVTKFIVDRLEMVYIGEYQRDGMAVTGQSRHLQVSTFFDVAAVPGTGQWIGRGTQLHVFDGLRQLRDGALCMVDHRRGVRIR